MTEPTPPGDEKDTEPRKWTGAELMEEVKAHPDLFSKDDFARMLADLRDDQSPGRTETDDDSDESVPIPPLLVEVPPSELEIEFAMQTVRRILHRTDPEKPLDDSATLAWCHMHALRDLHAVQNELDEIQALLDVADVRWADENTSEVLPIATRVRWLIANSQITDSSQLDT